MTLDTVIMLFGAIVAVLPFLQFPPEWTTWLVFAAGVIIVGLGIVVRRRSSPSISISETSTYRQPEPDVIADDESE